MKLQSLAHSRTGDKGDTSNISIIAYRPEDYLRLCEQLTAERVAAFFAGLLEPSAAPVRRYELPNVHALNFVLPGILRGGVTRSLALDAHGKCLGSALLDMEIPPYVGASLLAKIVNHNEGNLTPSGVLRFFASTLAPGERAFFRRRRSACPGNR